MSKPETSIFPIEHGKLTTDLDANNLQILNLDTSNLPGGSGNDTGTTTAILKGDGDHGFADAVADVDYASVGSVSGFETSATHDADIALVTADITTLETDLATLTTVVGNKADASNVSDALALKENITDHDADITAVEGDIATVASDLATLTTAVGNKADSASVSAALAGKEPLLPTTVNDSYVLARHNAGGTDQWFFVDPVTLGSTNASYGDGATHSNTTFNSTLAVFSADDTGKTIVCAGNIPTDTTITFVNATTVTLSNAATTTASGLTFTILNRFLPSGSSSGTVTSVAVNNNATTLLSIPSVSNPTTNATITINSTTPAAHTFYGNNTGVAAVPIFMDALQARNNLGGTVVGQAIFQVNSVGAISYPRVAADSTCAMFTRPQVVSDLGVENALTFNAPLSRATNTISIPAAVSSPAQVNGYLTGADHALFTAKVSSAITITTTAPLSIGGVSGGNANLTANRTIAMPASTGNADGSSQVDGYLSGTDHTLFANKPPNSRTIAVLNPMTMSPGTAITGGIQGDLSANRTISMSQASATLDGYLGANDFSKFALGSPNTNVLVTGGSQTINSLNPPINRMVFVNPLLSTLNVTLPSATNYSAALQFPFLEFVDLVTGGAMANFGMTLIAASGQTIDGAASITIPRGTGYLRINSNGSRWFTTKYYTRSISNPTNPLGIANFNAGNLTTTSTINVPNADSTFVVPPTVVPAGWVKTVNTDGTLTHTIPNATDILPQVIYVGTSGVPLSGVATIAGEGLYDTIAIVGSLTGALTLQLPNADFYQQGEELTVVDFSGTVGQSHPVTITSTNGTDTFNNGPTGGGSLSVLFDEANGKRSFTRTAALNWSVPFAKAVTVKAFSPAITAVNSTFTLNVDPSASGAQNGHIVLASGANNLAIAPAPFDGMRMDLVVVQPSSGAAGTLNLPSPSYVAGNGAGVVTLSSANSAIDRIVAVYDGVIPAYIWEVPKLNHTAVAAPTAPTTLAAGTITSNSIVLTWVDATGETSYDLQRSTDNITFANVANPGANIITVTDTGLAPSTTYYYKIRAVNSGGASAYTSTLTTATISGCSTAANIIGRASDNTWASTGVAATIANGASQLYVAANNFVPTATNTSVCRIALPIYRTTTSVTTILTAYIFTSSGVSPSNVPTTVITNGTSTNTIAGGNVPIGETNALSTPLLFTFSGVTLVAGTQYFIVVGASALAGAAGSNNYKWVCSGNQTSTWLSYRSPDNATWTAFTAAANNRCFIQTYK